MNCKRLLGMTTAGFPLWIVLGCMWAWSRPGEWIWFRPHIEVGLGVIMLGMGLTLGSRISPRWPGSRGTSRWVWPRNFPSCPAPAG